MLKLSSRRGRIGLKQERIALFTIVLVPVSTAWIVRWDAGNERLQNFGSRAIMGNRRNFAEQMLPVCSSTS